MALNFRPIAFSSKPPVVQPVELQPTDLGGNRRFYPDSGPPPHAGIWAVKDTLVDYGAGLQRSYERATNFARRNCPPEAAICQGMAGMVGFIGGGVTEAGSSVIEGGRAFQEAQTTEEKINAAAAVVGGLSSIVLTVLAPASGTESLPTRGARVRGKPVTPRPSTGLRRTGTYKVDGGTHQYGSVAEGTTLTQLPGRSLEPVRLPSTMEGAQVLKPIPRIDSVITPAEVIVIPALEGFPEQAYLPLKLEEYIPESLPPAMVQMASQSDDVNAKNTGESVVIARGEQIEERGHQFMKEKRYDKAEQAYQSALAAYQLRGDSEGKARARRFLNNVYIIRIGHLQQKATALATAEAFGEAAVAYKTLADFHGKRVELYRGGDGADDRIAALTAQGVALEQWGDMQKENVDDEGDIEVLIKSLGAKDLERWIMAYGKVSEAYDQAVIFFERAGEKQKKDLLARKKEAVARGMSMMNSMLVILQQIPKENAVIVPMVLPFRTTGFESTAAFQRAREIFERVIRDKGRITFLTGAGVSAESGVPTFRDEDVIWHGHSILDLASRETLEQQPFLAWRFYDDARFQLNRKIPNSAHLAIADLEKLVGRNNIVVITQNVDGLHQRAGSTNVLEIHGSIWRLRCTSGSCSQVKEDRRPRLPELPPICENCGAIMRPDVVLFEEFLDERLLEASEQAAKNTDLFVVMGTSGVVWPAAELVPVARQSGIPTLQVNLTPTDASDIVDMFVQGKAGEVLPRMIAGLK